MRVAVLWEGGREREGGTPLIRSGVCVCVCVCVCVPLLPLPAVVTTIFVPPNRFPHSLCKVRQ